MQQVKKTTVIALALLMLFSMTLNAYAVTFSDINDAPWARTHIERMADKGIVSGSIHPTTNQRVYLPNNPVTKVESVVLLYSLLEKTGNLMSSTNYTSKYQTMLNTSRIPEWAQKQVAYGLEEGIITTSDLSSFMREGNPDPLQNPASREEVAIFFGRALDVDNKAGSTSISLSFADTEQIGSAALPYVNFLVSKRIISGDDQNRFNPRATITRAEMAAITNKTYDVVEEDDDVVIDLTPSNNNTTTSDVIDRKIEQINTDTRIIFVLDDDNNLEMYRITQGAEIMINSASARISDLRKGQNAELTLNRDNEIIKLDINPQRNEMRVIVRYITDVSDYYVMSVENVANSSDRRNFRVYSTTDITLNGRSARIGDIETGDELLIFHDGLNVIRITDELSKESVTEGILDSLTINRYPFYLTIRGVGNVRTEYEIDEDVRVYINNRRDNLSGLTVGDIITLVITDGLVTEIDAIGQNRSTEVTGTLREILMSRPNRITIVDRDNKESTYVLSDDVSIYVNDTRASLSDLSVNATVELTIRNGEVTEIEASRSSGRSVIQGEILRFYDSINRMLVDHINPTTNRYEEILVYVNRDTIFIDYDGKSIDFGALNRNDFVLITGSYEDGAFIASRVVVVED